MRTGIFKKFTKIIYIITFVLIAAVIVFARKEMYHSANIIYIGAMGLASAMGLIRCIKNFNDISVPSCRQMLPILLIFALFLDCSLIHNVSGRINYKYFTAAFIAIHSNLFWVARTVITSGRMGNPLKAVRKEWILAVIIMIFTILSVLQFRANNVWDSAIYEASMSRLKEIEYTSKSVSLLYICSHQSAAYAVIMGIGEFIMPVDGIGIRVMQLIVSDVTIIMMYSLICRLTRRTKMRYIYLILFACSPLFLGINHYISVDMAVLCFFVWMVYSNVGRHRIFEIFTIFLVCFSKETGLVLVFAYYFSIFITYSFKNKKLLIPAAGLCVAAGVMYILAMKGIIKIWNPGEDVYEVLSINSERLSIKLKTMFFGNFSYIFYLLILICGILAFIRRERMNSYFNFLLLTTVIYTVFHIVYNKYSHFRYFQTYAFLLVILLVILIEVLPEKLSRYICIVIAALSLIQSFFTIDPIMRATHRNAGIAGTQLVSGESVEEKYIFSDAAIYNYEYQYYFQCLNKILKEIGYDGTQKLLMPKMRTIKSLNYYTQIGQTIVRYELYYVPRLGRICLIKDTEKYEKEYMEKYGYKLQVTFVKSAESIQNAGKKYDKVYYIDTEKPYGMSFTYDIEKELPGYKTVKCMSAELRYAKVEQ